jgi:3-oxoacyl-[acyl-carrier-protein] synthase-3
MIGIKKIGTYLPPHRVSNMELMDRFDTNEEFLRNKIGVLKRAIKANNEMASDLCIQAFNNLLIETDISVESIECCVVVTQNPDTSIPHVSAIVHGALELPETCATFDISLGCSGYVYGLSIIQAWMKAQGMKCGLLFTADPYSDIIDKNDKNTALIFGDGATVTLLEEGASCIPLGFDFGSKGSGYKNLMKKETLFMNGRAVFNFTASIVPKSIESLLTKLELSKDDIDSWYFHQGSKYIVDTITKRLELDPKKVKFGMQEYGNTISSSIPMLLADDLDCFASGQKIVLSGFGVGLSWASCVLKFQ